MILYLNRKLKNTNSIIGTLSIEQTKLCDTLENANKCIPQGIYPVKLSFSHRFQKILPEILNVPDRTGIRIHAGNKPDDSSGCILVGEYKNLSKEYIYNSQKTLSYVMDCLNKNNVEYLRITDI